MAETSAKNAKVRIPKPHQYKSKRPVPTQEDEVVLQVAQVVEVNPEDHPDGDGGVVRCAALYASLVALCFCWQALIIGTMGTLAGVGLGFTVLHFRNDIIAGFTRLTGSEEALLRFYEFSNLPSHLSNDDLTLIISSAIIISVSYTHLTLPTKRIV